MIQKLLILSLVLATSLSWADDEPFKPALDCIRALQEVSPFMVGGYKKIQFTNDNKYMFIGGQNSLHVYTNDSAYRVTADRDNRFELEDIIEKNKSGEEYSDLQCGNGLSISHEHYNDLKSEFKAKNYVNFGNALIGANLYGTTRYLDPTNKNSNGEVIVSDKKTGTNSYFIYYELEEIWYPKPPAQVPVTADTQTVKNYNAEVKKWTKEFEEWKKKTNTIPRVKADPQESTSVSELNKIIRDNFLEKDSDPIQKFTENYEENVVRRSRGDPWLLVDLNNSMTSKKASKTYACTEWDDSRGEDWKKLFVAVRQCARVPELEKAVNEKLKEYYTGLKELCTCTGRISMWDEDTNSSKIQKGEFEGSQCEAKVKTLLGDPEFEIVKDDFSKWIPPEDRK